jgi:hypothetical protein
MSQYITSYFDGVEFRRIDYCNLVAVAMFFIGGLFFGITSGILSFVFLWSGICIASIVMICHEAFSRTSNKTDGEYRFDP